MKNATTKDSLEQTKEFYLETYLLSEEIPPEKAVAFIKAILIDVYGEEITEDNIWRKAEQRLFRASEIESLKDRRHYLQLWHAHTLHSLHQRRKEVSEATTWPAAVDAVARLEVLRHELREIENELDHLDNRWEFHHRIYRSEIGRKPYAERNKLYDQISRDAEQMWQEGSELFHTEMAQHWKDKHSDLSLERLRQLLRPIASKYEKVATPGRSQKPEGEQVEVSSKIELNLEKAKETSGYRHYRMEDYDQEYLKSLTSKKK